MRSYTNREGEQINVDEKHLNAAVRIKLELQSASPSRRCSWSKLVEMMAEEGYDDADNTESYRLMVKNYQSSIGMFGENGEEESELEDSLFGSVKNAVGNIAFRKRDNQNVLRELNKVKREIVDSTIKYELINKAFADYDWSKLKLDIKENNNSSKSKMIVCLSDMHIGALVDISINKYNYNIATQRITKYAEKIIEEANKSGVLHIDIVNIGDVIEHSNMRYGQGFSSEFVYNEQIVKASDLIIKFIIAIAERGFEVTYAGIAGNHDRANDKDKNLHGDHAVKPINYAISLLSRYNKELSNFTYIETEDYSHKMLDVNGRNIKFLHGDLDSHKDENVVARHSVLDNVLYDIVVNGHVHHYRDIEVGHNKRQITFGSLKGADEYGEKIRKISAASQGYLIIDEEGHVKSVKVELE